MYILNHTNLAHWQLRTWGAVIKVQVTQDDVKGHQVFQHLLSFRWLRWRLAKLSPPLEQQVQLLTTYGGITWQTVQCLCVCWTGSVGMQQKRGEGEINTKRLLSSHPSMPQWNWPELIYKRGSKRGADHHGKHIWVLWNASQHTLVSVLWART